MNGTTSASLIPSYDFTPTFSGHETFVLRSNWLKKAYDLLLDKPDLFAREDAFVLLGVGKNMAQSIRYWGKVCGVFERDSNGRNYTPTTLGHKLLADDGWDPFLVTATSWWFLHWQIAAHPQAAFTWFYTFNLLRGGEFTIPQLVAQLLAFAQEHNWKVPSEATMTRDVECMVHCYVQPAYNQRTVLSEDTLLCPLTEPGLIQPIPGLRSYLLKSGPQPELADELVAYALHDLVAQSQRQTIALSALAYMPRSPGRVFRLDEDSLLSRLQRLEEITQGRAYYHDQAGIRQVAWTGDTSDDIAYELLERAFCTEKEVL
jgi:hypothetical protein